MEKNTEIYMMGISVEDFFAKQREVLATYHAQMLKETQLFLKEFLEKESERREIKYVYGIKGLAKALDVSKATAARIKASGDLDDAIDQTGRIIRIDEELAKKLYFTKNEL